MANENEFAVDTPEVYQQDETLNAPPQVDSPAPPVDDMDVEPPAAEVVPPAPVAPAPAAPAPVAAAAPAASFDRRAPIAGLKEPENLTVEGIALQTKEILSKQPKVRMMIPLDPGEKPGAYRTVIINGYRFDVRKNTMVDLPESVANLLSESYRITNDVLENNPTNLNRADEEKRRALGLS